MMAFKDYSHKLKGNSRGQRWERIALWEDKLCQWENITKDKLMDRRTPTESWHPWKLDSWVNTLTLEGKSFP